MSTAVETFWAENQVGGPYDTLEESEQALIDRAQMFPGLEWLMPTVFPGDHVLDFGCGPGHDTVQFLRNGASHVYYADTSKLALKTTRDRLKLHGLEKDATPLLVDESRTPDLPRVDHAHCAGVLHHTTRPARVLDALQRTLRPEAELRLMVYDGGASVPTQSEVPVTNWWTQEQVKKLALDARLHAEYVGGYDCSAEWRPNCQAACYRMWSR